jgi:hypothetical protein
LTPGSTPAIVHDLMQPGQEFPTCIHPIHFFFGLNEFVTLTPNAPKEKEDIGSDTRAKVRHDEHETTKYRNTL